MEQFLKRYKFKKFTDEHAQMIEEMTCEDTWSCLGFQCHNCPFNNINNVNGDGCGVGSNAMITFGLPDYLEKSVIIGRAILIEYRSVRNDNEFWRL